MRNALRERGFGWTDPTGVLRPGRQVRQVGASSPQRRRRVVSVMPRLVVGCLLTVLTVVDVETIQGLPRLEGVRLLADVVVGGGAVAAVAGFRWGFAVAGSALGSLGLSVVLAWVLADPPMLGAAELAGLLILGVMGVRRSSGGWQMTGVIVVVAAATVGGGLLRQTPGFGVVTDVALSGVVPGGGDRGGAVVASLVAAPGAVAGGSPA